MCPPTPLRTKNQTTGRHWSTGAVLDDGLHSVVDTTGSDESTAEQLIDPVDNRKIAGSMSVGQPGRSPPVVASFDPRVGNHGHSIPCRRPDKPPPPGHLGGGGVTIAGQGINVSNTQTKSTVHIRLCGPGR